MIIEQILNNLKECDDFHNRCDYLLEHDEITYLLKYIIELQQENKQLKDKIDKVIEYIKTVEISSILEVHCGCDEEYTEPLLEILKGEENENKTSNSNK